MVGPRPPRAEALFRPSRDGPVERGIWHTLQYDATLPFRLAGALLFVFLGAFFLLNVALGRRWSWPWKGFVAAFALLFLVRILFGA